MVAITALLWPILLSAVLVFLASSLFHMVLPWHRKDYSKLPGEDQVAEALRKAGAGPGDYMMPYADSPAAMQDPAFQEKVKRGPLASITIFSDYAMGKSLGLWFVYCVVVGIFCAYVVGRAVAPGAAYREIFQLTSTVAFLGYGLAQWQNSIWYKRQWSTTIKFTIDSVVYGLLTGGAFGWLWPEA